MDSQDTTVPEVEVSIKRNIRISPSSLNEFLSCPRKYKHSRLDNLRLSHKGPPRSQEDKGFYLEKGDFIHVLLRMYYKAILLGLQKKESRELSKIYGRGYAPQSDLPIAISEQMIEYFDDYVNFWATERWKPVEVEEAFSEVLYEDEQDRIIIEGIIDLVVDTGDFLMPIDHKTSGSYGPTQDMSNQFKCYCWYSKSKRLCVNKIQVQKSVGDRARFSRPIVNYREDILEEWRENVAYVCKLMTDYEENDFFPQNETSCYKFNNACAYIHLCKAPARAREHVANRDYEVHIEDKWDPEVYLKRQNEELAWLRQHA